jgi:hypothetical protein
MLAVGNSSVERLDSNGHLAPSGMPLAFGGVRIGDLGSLRDPRLRSATPLALMVERPSAKICDAAGVDGGASLGWDLRRGLASMVSLGVGNQDVTQHFGDGAMSMSYHIAVPQV